ERIEVLRGPFSTLYGNASGGVVAVFTESGTPVPEIDVTAGGGSFDSWTIGTKLRGSAGALRYVLAGTHFSTGGFRDHSSARRTLGAGKLTMSLGERTELTLLGTSQSQPESED